jgi:hypothetical protein
MIPGSIFGNMSPKFVYDLGGPNQYSVQLNYWVPTADEPTDDRDIIQDSELEADREIIDRGNFWLFEGRVNLYMYGSLVNIRSKFEEIYQFHKKKVVLWKHKDKEPYKDKNGNNVLWYLKVVPKNLYTLDYRDVLLLSFRSLKEVNHSNNSVIIPQPTEIIITDEINVGE